MTYRWTSLWEDWFYTCLMPFLSPNQRYQSIKGISAYDTHMHATLWPCMSTYQPDLRILWMTLNTLTILILLSVHSWASSLARRVTSSEASAIALAQSIRSLLVPPSPLQINAHSTVKITRYLLSNDLTHTSLVYCQQCIYTSYINAANTSQFIKKGDTVQLPTTLLYSTHRHTHTHSILTATFQGKPGLASCLINSPSPFIPGLHILLGQT